GPAAIRPSHNQAQSQSGPPYTATTQRSTNGIQARRSAARRSGHVRIDPHVGAHETALPTLDRLRLRRAQDHAYALPGQRPIFLYRRLARYRPDYAGPSTAGYRSLVGRTDRAAKGDAVGRPLVGDRIQ